MTDVTHTGDGLGVLIDCQSLPAHHWMAFALWRSLREFLPDAKVCIGCLRGAAFIPFEWVERCKVPFFRHTSEEPLKVARTRELLPENSIILPPHVLAVRPYCSSFLGPSPASGNEATTFVDYLDGVGTFVAASGIHKFSDPFSRSVKRFGNERLTANELRVLTYWQELEIAYRSVV